MSMLGCPNDFHEENCSFSVLKKKRVTDRWTDHPTDGRTDMTSYRDTRTHLKTLSVRKKKTQKTTWTEFEMATNVFRPDRLTNQNQPIATKLEETWYGVWATNNIE